MKKIKIGMRIKNEKGDVRQIIEIDEETGYANLEGVGYKIPPTVWVPITSIKNNWEEVEENAS